MPELLSALNAFLEEHRRCRELDGGAMMVRSGSPANAGPASRIASSGLDRLVVSSRLG